MFIRKRRGWEIPESMATPEELVFNRRGLLKTVGAAALIAGIAACGDEDGAEAGAAPDAGADPSAALYPVKRNAKYTLDRALTDEKIVASYNNYYEFGGDKNIVREAQRLKLRPWQISIEGMVEKPFKIDIDTLLQRMPLEERLYRHRCVESWAFAAPWSGFALKSLIDYAKPTANATYVVMKTFQNPSVAPGQKEIYYPWPYTEGLTLPEARNELAFMVTGAYGKPLAKQNGAPLRLAVPWKYGFKSIKGIQRIIFTNQRPKSYWEALQKDEYGFWANVNPQVPHPRWSQATEELLGTGRRVPTQLYNGYAEYVAPLYANMKGETLYR
jgi:methionine sulfoxide reductase catalytic subunit